MFECSGKAMFGATWPEDDAFYEAFCRWDKGTYNIIKGYPWIFTRKSIQAREEYYRRLLKIFEEGLQGPGRLVRERVKVRILPSPFGVYLANSWIGRAITSVDSSNLLWRST
jgi:hypothetical protein